MKKTKQKLFRVTPEDWELLRQNPKIFDIAIQNAKELSIGCVFAKKELIVIKGLNYQILVITDEKLIVLQSDLENKVLSFQKIETKHLSRLQEFVRQNPTYSHNLIYKFNNILSNDEN